MKIKLSTLLYLVFASTAVLAQNSPVPQTSPATETPARQTGRITGRVLDAQTQEPLPFVNVVLLSLPDSSLVTGANTSFQGNFNMNQVSYGRYVLRATLVGYEPLLRQVTLSAQQPELQLGNLSLSSGSTSLREVEVIAERELIEYGLDRKIVNVDENVAATGGSAVDILQTVPSVEVDVDGNVSLRGSDNVTVWVNGRPSGLTRSGALGQIPASSIERIELITNPSAKYDPDGTGGIINIVLKKQQKPGLNGLVQVTAGTRHKYNGSLGLNYRTGKFNFFGNYDGRYNERWGTGESNRTTTIGGTITYLDQDEDSFDKDITHNIKGGFDYQITEQQSLTLYVLHNLERDRGDENIHYHRFYQNGLNDYFYNRNSDEKSDESATDYSLGYRKLFAQKGRELTADAIFTTSEDLREERYTQQNRPTDLEPTPPLDIQNSRTYDESTFLSLQTDYVHPLSENSRFETGWKSTFRKIDSDFDLQNFNNSSNEWERSLQSNEFLYKEDIHAIYAIYSNKFRKLTYQAGLRAEQAFTTSEQLTTAREFENNYFSLFPSLYLTQDLSEAQKLQLNYSRRINRPRTRMLNPFLDFEDPLNLRRGNPELQPEYVHSVELNHLLYFKQLTLTSGLFYRYTTDMFQRYRTLLDGDTTLMTFINLDNSQTYGFEFAISGAINNWWRANGSISGFQYVVDGGNLEDNFQSSSLSWNAKLNNSFSLPYGVELQVNTFYRAPVETPQTTRLAMFFTDLGLKKDVLDGRGTLTFRLSDVFDSRRFAYEQFGEYFELEGEHKRESRIAYIGFSYRIGSDKPKQNRRQNRPAGDGGAEMDDF